MDTLVDCASVILPVKCLIGTLISNELITDFNIIVTVTFQGMIHGCYFEKQGRDNLIDES